MRIGLIISLLFIASFVFSAPVVAQRQNMSVYQRPANFLIRTKRTKEQKQRMTPHQADLKRYEQLLQQPRTGIFRLMPDIGCTDNSNIIRADAVCLEYIPESSYYSFREKEHTIEILADIRLRNGYLITDGILSQSILVRLGDVELEKVDTNAAGFDFLSNFSPNPQGSDAQKQFLQLIRGVKVGNFEYKKALPIIENSTYALRAIAYRGSLYRSFRGFRYDLLEGDKRIDMTLVFRVIRKDPDGGVTVLWRELERRDAPRFVFPKRRR